MAQPGVRTYIASWYLPQGNAPGHGAIQINTFDGGGRSYAITSPDEMHMLVDLLRNERPVYLDIATNRLYTEWEPVGEGDKSP